MSQYYPNQLPPQNTQQQQQQLHQQQQQQPIPQQQQQQPYYPTPQNYFHQGSNQQYPEGNAANVGGHQHYPGAPSSANQQPSQDNHQQPYSYQQQMHQQFSAQHQQFPYSAAANGGYAGSHPTPQSYHPQNHQQHQHYQQQQLQQQPNQLQQQQQELQRQQQQQAQHQQRNPSISFETQASTNEINWVPKGYDLNQLDMWFSNLDSENRGYIGGARAVSFLSGFNLSRDTLRLIWGLVDSQNTGCIDVKQFYMIIRMVAISCSSTYAGAAPSMETYYRTVEEIIPLPPLSNSIVMSGDTGPVAVSLPSEPVLVAAIPVNNPGTSSIQKPSAENGWHNGYAPPDMTAQNHPVSSDGPLSSALSNTQHQQMHVIAGVNHLNHMIPIQAEQKVDDDFEFSDFESATVPSVSVSPFEDFGLPAPVPVPTPVPTPALNLAPDNFASISISSLPIPVQMTDNLSDIISRPDSSDFGDFNEPSVPVIPSHPSISPSAVPSLPVPTAPVMLAPLLNNGAGASNSRISFFDDLIESDLQVAGAGEWEDFVEGTAAVPEMQVSTQEPEAAADAANPFDMFDTDDSPSNPESAAENLGTGTGTDSSDQISSVLIMSDVFNIGESSSEQISNGSAFMMPDVVTAIEQTTSVKKASNFKMNDAYNDESFVAYEENAFFGDTQSTSVISESIFQPSDSFSFPVMDTPKAPAVIPPIVQITPIDFSAEFEDEDFGDFEEANFAETVSDGTVSIPAVAASSAFTADFSSAPITMDPSAGDSRFDSMNLLFMDEDVPMPTVSNTSSSSFLSTLSKSTPIPIPFLDVQFPVQRFPQDIASGNTTAEIFSPAPITYPPLAPAPAYASAPTTPLSQPQQISELIPKEDIIVNYSISNSSSRVRTDKYSSSEIDSMELLMATLSSKNFFDEAFCCAQKVSLLKSIDQLNREKVAAIDADDLEAAVTIKKKLIALKSSPTLLEDETVWAAVASSSKQGESLSDLVELLQAVDPSKGPWGRGLLLSLQGVSGDSNVADRISKALSVKRSLRMAIAVGTTHSKFSQYWLLLLNHVSSAVQNTSNIIDAFNRLKVADKEAVLSCEKMKIFIAGSLQIAELGLWVSASCLESNEHQIVAERVVAQCHIFAKAAEAIWSSGAKGSASQFSLPTVKALSQAAAEQAAFTGSKEVVYCYLTLRPLAATLRGSDVSEPICGAVRGKHKESGENFLKSALSIWSQEISTGLPECDGSF